MAARERAGDACAREEVPRGGPGGAGGFSRVHLTAGAKQSTREERDGGEGVFVISENPGTCR